MAWNMEQSDRKNSIWSSLAHFSLSSPVRVTTQDRVVGLVLAEVNSFNKQ